MTRRAQLGDEDLSGWQSDGHQLITGRGPRIEIPMIAPSGLQACHGRIRRGRRGRRPEPSFELGVAEAGAPETVSDVDAHFVAARTDRRPGRGDQIIGTAAKLASERGHSRPGNTRRRSPPSGVGRRGRAGSSIGDKQRHAVGRSHGQGESRVVRHDDVGLRTETRGLTGNQNVGSVHLVDTNEARGVALQRLGHIRPAPVVAFPRAR